MTNELIVNIKDSIREIPDFPKKGILFLDITTALKDPAVLKTIIDQLTEKFKNEKIDYVAGIESRGFMFGVPLAYNLNAGFVPIRKPNKLPAETLKESYSLEYGTDTIEIHADALEEGSNVLVVDDLLATGGTANAACNLIHKAGANIVSTAFLIELTDLNGREKLEDKGINTYSMLQY